MKKLKTLILSWLLHRANREYVDFHFYKVKNKILTKYGKHICYDVQFIEGKECFACKGTGIYNSYYHNSWHKETCYKCYGGWYKRPEWNILAKVKFGKYAFHQPFQRVYIDPKITANTIHGYIDHTKAKWGATSLFLLMLIYERGFLKRWYKKSYFGWRVYWYYPKNIIPNIFHFIKHGRKSMPIMRLKDKLNQFIHRVKQKERINKMKYEIMDDDLPF
jgi:hypothetical protein